MSRATSTDAELARALAAEIRRVRDELRTHRAKRVRTALPYDGGIKIIAELTDAAMRLDAAGDNLDNIHNTINA